MLYILELENNKYYIGKTNRPVSRIIEHFRNNGSEWTKLYKPLKVVNMIENTDEFDEDKYTKIYMKKFGIDNVRGGSYCQIKLPKYQIQSLQDEFNTINNSCFGCNQTGHFVKDCKQTNDIENYFSEEAEKSGGLVNYMLQGTVDGIGGLVNYMLQGTVDGIGGLVNYMLQGTVDGIDKHEHEDEDEPTSTSTFVEEPTSTTSVVEEPTL